MKKLFILLLFAAITSTSSAQTFGQEEPWYDPCYNTFLGYNNGALANYDSDYADCVTNLVGTGKEAAAKAYLAAHNLPSNTPDTTGNFLLFELSQTDTGGDAIEMAAAQNCEGNAESTLDGVVQADLNNFNNCPGLDDDDNGDNNDD
jgi:hypothetical protein